MDHQTITKQHVSGGYSNPQKKIQSDLITGRESNNTINYSGLC